MTTRTKVTFALGFTLVLFALAAALRVIPSDPSGRTAPPRPNDSAAASETGCAASALALMEAGETELGAESLDLCLNKNPSLESERTTGEKAAAAAFESLMSGWSPPWPGEDGAASTTLPPAALADKLAATEKFLENFPEGYNAGLAVVLKALILYQRGKYDACLRWLNQNSFRNGMPDFSLYLSALAAWKSGQPDTATGYAGHALEAHPENPFTAEAAILASRILKEKGDYSAAAQKALEAAAIPAPPAARGRAFLAAADAFLAAGDRQARVKAVLEIARLYPEADTDVFLEKNLDLKNDPLSRDDLLLLGRYFDAKDRGYPLVQIFSTRSGLPPEGAYLLAKGYFLSGDYNKALKAREKLTAPGAPEEFQARSCLLLARIFEKRNKTADALRQYETCANKYPSARAEAYERSARIFLADKDEANQARALEKLLDAAPDHTLAPDALLLTARHYLISGNSATAEKFHDTLVRRFPESYQTSEALFWLGKSAYDHYDFNRSAEILSDLRERFPYSYHYFRAADYLGALDKKPENMSDLIRRSRENHSFKPRESALLRTANALRRLNVYQPALDFFSMSAKKYPNEAAAGAARTLRRSGNLPISIRTIEDRAKIDPAFYLAILASPDLTELLFPRLFVKKTTPEAARYNMPPAWPVSIIRQESRFNAGARSSSNALGLMQIIPSTGKWIAQQRKLRYPGDKGMYDPLTNIDYGVWYFDHLLKMGHIQGNHALALAAYNGGPGNVRRWKEKFGMDDIDLFIEKMPRAETRGYVKKVMLNYYVYEALLAEK